MFKRITAIVLLIIMTGFSLALSQVPKEMTYQGVLTDNAGTPLSGNYNLTFRIYDSASAGNELWTESHSSVVVSNGLFSVIIGTIDPLTNPLDLPFDQKYWISMEIGTSGELGRMGLSSVGYSYRSSKADSAENFSGTAGGDLTGNYPNPTINRKGAANGQVLKWNAISTAWEAGDDNSGGSPSGTAGGDLSGTYPNPTVTKILGDSISTTTPVVGQTLKWNGSAWTPEADSAGGNTLDQAYDQGGTGAGRAISADNGAFEVNGIDGALFGGTHGSGTLPDSGAGTRMMWYPGKSAFRAGNVTSNQWDDSNIGLFSTAMGHATTARGNYSTAMGWSTLASGTNSMAMGYATTASGSYSTSMGYETGARGNYSTAMGFMTTASGSMSMASGYSTTASGDYSIALGSNIEAAGMYTIAIGNTGTVTQDHTMAINGLRVGIGRLSPSTSLEILSSEFDEDSKVLKLVHRRTPSVYWQMAVEDQAGDEDLIFYFGETQVAAIDNDGGYQNLSDKRAKRNIEPLSETLGKVLKLKPSSFYMKDSKNSDGPKSIGFIAQDVDDVFSNYDIVGKEEEYWNLTYDAFGVLAIAAIQELKTEKDTEINDLKSELKTLKNENHKLKKHLTELTSAINKLQIMMTNLQRNSDNEINTTVKMTHK